MINIVFNNFSFQRTYLREIELYNYESFLSLVLEIFSRYKFEDKEAELLVYELLQAGGHRSIEDIPFYELEVIADYFLAQKERFKVEYDEEKLTYILLAAIQREEIIAMVDDIVITDLQAPISLRSNSMVNFIKKDKIKTITFKTL